MNKMLHVHRFKATIATGLLKLYVQECIENWKLLFIFQQRATYSKVSYLISDLKVMKYRWRMHCTGYWKLLFTFQQPATEILAYL